MAKRAVLIVLDLDGTCCDASRRHKMAGIEPDRSDKKAYGTWLRRVQSKKLLAEDPVVPGMRELAIATKDNAVYLTARNERYREVTKKWLKKQGFPDLPLYMRPLANKDRASDFKEKVIDKILKKEKQLMPVVMIDDDQRGDIEEMCKKRSFTFLKAKSG